VCPSKDIISGADSSSPSSLKVMGTNLFFVADDGVHGRELWISDGTSAGTVMIQDINPGLPASNPTSLTVVNGVLFFMAEDPVDGAELWKYVP